MFARNAVLAEFAAASSAVRSRTSTSTRRVRPAIEESQLASSALISQPAPRAPSGAQLRRLARVSAVGAEST